MNSLFLAKCRRRKSDATPEPVLVSKYKRWLPDIRLHTVDPLKLRIKADSLLNECTAVDLGFAETDLLIATLIAGKFGANAKKMAPVRQAMIEHFLKQSPVETLAVAAKKVYTTELLPQFTLAQPTPAGTESLFADIPVFGTNRIAIRIPKMAEDKHTTYLSFCLSEFRAFVECFGGIPAGSRGFWSQRGVNVSVDRPIHEEEVPNFSEVPVMRTAVQVNYYEKDPGFKLEISGWKCTACGIVISEKARAEKKFGNANGQRPSPKPSARNARRSSAACSSVSIWLMPIKPPEAE